MPEVSSQQLAAHLQHGIQPLYILYGEEPLQLLESTEAIRAALGGAAGLERTSFTVSGVNFDWSQVLAALSGLSLFAQAQLIEINIPSGKPGRDGGVALERVAKMLPEFEGTHVLLVIPQPLDKATKNSAWFKALSQQATLISCFPVDIRILPQWLMQRMRQAGLQLNTGEDGKRAVAFLAEHVEGNLLAAHQEIEKMALLYASVSDELKVVGYDEVRKSVSNVARYDLFSLPQAILSGHVERSLKMLEGLIGEGQPMVRIHWVLSNEVMAIWRVRQLLDGGQPLPLALREARVWGPRERLFEQVLPNFSSRLCLRLLRYSQICDGVIKGVSSPGWPSDAKNALHKLVVEMIDAVCASRVNHHKNSRLALRLN